MTEQLDDAIFSIIYPKEELLIACGPVSMTALVWPHKALRKGKIFNGSIKRSVLKTLFCWDK